MFETWNFSNMSWELLIWNFQMRLEKEVLFEVFETCNFSNPSWGVAYLKLSDKTWNKIFYLKCLKLETSQTCHGSCLFETFRWDLKWDVLYETFETWNFSNMSWELLIWNFQMRLEKEVLFKIFETCNFSNPSWGVAYLKLSDETWNEMCYLKLLKLVTFQTHHGELLIWNFQMRLEKEVLFEIFETCNFSNPSWGVAYLKLSDETWNEMCYLKLLKLETFQTFKPITGVGYLKHSDKTWYEMCYLKFWNILTFSNSSWELLIWNFQMRLQTRYSIWNVWNLKLLKHVMGVAYLKLSDETWNEMCYMKLLKLETSQTCHGSCLFETFRWDLKKRCYLKFFKLETFQTHHGELLIWNFQMRLEMRCAIWNFWNLKLFKPIMGSCLFETFRWDLKWDVLY